MDDLNIHTMANFANVKLFMWPVVCGLVLYILVSLYRNRTFYRNKVGKAIPGEQGLWC